MNLLKNILALFLLLGLYAPSYAAVNDIKSTSCAVFNEEGGKDGEKKEDDEEEEPDCE